MAVQQVVDARLRRSSVCERRREQHEQREQHEIHEQHEHREQHESTQSEEQVLTSGDSDGSKKGYAGATAHDETIIVTSTRTAGGRHIVRVSERSHC